MWNFPRKININSVQKTSKKRLLLKLQPNVWQELRKDTHDVVRMVRVEDHGILKSTRKYKKKTFPMLPEIIPQEVETSARNV